MIKRTKDEVHHSGAGFYGILTAEFGCAASGQAAEADQLIFGPNFVTSEGTLPQVEFSTAQPTPRKLWAFVPSGSLGQQEFLSEYFLVWK